MHWFLDPIQNKYADFSGRASRQEFWMFTLTYMILYIGIFILEGLIDSKLLTFAFAIVLLVPSVAITTRRLHDIDKNGWWQLIGIIPLVGIIVMIVWLASKGEAGENQYGLGVDNLSESMQNSSEQAEAGVPTVSMAEETPLENTDRENMQG